MAKEQTIVGLDVGTCFVRTVIAKYKAGQPKPHIIGIGQSNSSGLRRGVIVDVEEAIKSINESVQEAKRSSGYPIEQVYVSIGGSHITSSTSKGVVAVSRADEEVSEEDVARAINAASAVSVSPNRDILHVIPRNFSVDDQTGIKDPVGMSGVRLEVDTIIIEGGTPHIKNITKCVQEAGLEIEGLIVAPLAAARAVLAKRQKELGVLVLDLGGGTAGLTIFEEGDIVHNYILPIGSSHVTSDIAIGLRSDIDLAEKIKLEYGTSLVSEINKKDSINLAKLSLEEKGTISRMEVVEIIEARLCEILDLTNKELKRIDRQGLLPAGVVLVGGGSKMPGLVDLTKEKLKLPAQIGFPIELEGVIEEVDDPAYATAVGLVLWGMDVSSSGTHQGLSLSGHGGIFSKILNWVKGFLP